MKKIILSGGSGLIGRSLTSFLEAEGHQVRWLGRKHLNDTQRSYFWEPQKKEIDANSLIGKDVLIQLAGTNIAGKRWTNKRKKDIINSRIQAIQILYDTLKKSKLRIPHIIQASAIGFYGNRGLEKLNEESSWSEGGFLAEVCKLCESEAECLKEFTDHFTIIRTGLYLSPAGGIWPELIQTRKFGFLVYFGDGSQIYSWIHYLDFNRAISWIINQQLSGIINMTAPNPVNNKLFISEIQSQLNRAVIKIRVPGFVLNCLLGELSQLILYSDNVFPEVLKQNGFQFQFEYLEDAVKDLLK